MNSNYDPYLHRDQRALLPSPREVEDFLTDILSTRFSNHFFTTHGPNLHQYFITSLLFTGLIKYEEDTFLVYLKNDNFPGGWSFRIGELPLGNNQVLLSEALSWLRSPSGRWWEQSRDITMFPFKYLDWYCPA